MIKEQKIRFFIVSLTVFLLILTPFFVFGAGMIPCGGASPEKPCTFNDFIKMIDGIIKGTITFLSVYAAISFMYAGYAYLTSGGSQEKLSYAKGIFKKVLMGYIIVLTAWLFVSMLENVFYTDETNNRPNSFLNPSTSVTPNNT